MEPKSIVILVFLIIGLSIVVLNIWNIVGLKNLLKNRKLKDEQLNDSKYFELKYKYEFLMAIFSVVVGVIVFVGYDSYKSLRDNLKKDFEEKIASTTKKLDSQNDSINKQQTKIETLNTAISNNANKVTKIDDLVNFLEQQQIQLNEKLNSSKKSVIDYENSIDDLKRKIAEIKNKNIIKQELYIVKGLIYSYKDDWQYIKFQFDTIKTVNGENLPKFKEPPTIIPFTNNGIVLTIKDITNTSFEITASNNTTPNSPNNFPFSLLISVIEK